MKGENNGQITGYFHVYVIFYLISSNITENRGTKMILKELLSLREIFENEMYKMNLMFKRINVDVHVISPRLGN